MLTEHHYRFESNYICTYHQMRLAARRYLGLDENFSAKAILDSLIETGRVEPKNRKQNYQS